MDTKKRKVTSLITISLVILNVLVFGFIFFGKPSKPNHLEGPAIDRFIIEALDLSDNQVRIYRNYVHKHHETIRLLEKQKREATAYVINHNLPENQFIELDRLNHEIQKTHLAHLQEIKQLCTSEQKQKFQHHLAEFIQLFR